MTKRKKMTPEEKEAFLARINKGKRAVKPKAAGNESPEVMQKKKEPVTPRKPKIESDPEGKYPRAEIGHWNKNKKKLNKFMDDAFKLKHKDIEQGVERSGRGSGTPTESAKPGQPSLN